MKINMEISYPREAEKAKKEHRPLLIPVGTMEYHSSICPFGCDTLVAKGIADLVAEKSEGVVYPPIWYGVASYAVAGPEKNTVQIDCDNFERYIYDILKSLFLGGWRKNIYLLIAHQTEDYMPMTLACMKAAKKLIMETLEKEKGYGWWGNRENKDFYENLSEEDSPWNAIRTIMIPSEKVRKKHGADHAGIYECSMLESLYPGSIKIERLKEADDWFAESAIRFNKELGDDMVKMTVSEILDIIRG